MLFIVLIPCTSAVIILDRSSENVVYFPYLRHQDTLAIWGIGGLKYPSTIRCYSTPNATLGQLHPYPTEIAHGVFSMPISNKRGFILPLFAIRLRFIYTTP